MGASDEFDNVVGNILAPFAPGQINAIGIEQQVNPVNGEFVSTSERREAVRDVAIVATLVAPAASAGRFIKPAAFVNGETKFTSAGRLAHELEDLPEGFVRNVRIPGTRLRMDGYHPIFKEIIELKPPNEKQIRAGERQLNKYCAACDQSTLGPGHKARPVQTYDPSKYLDRQ